MIDQMARQVVTDVKVDPPYARAIAGQKVRSGWPTREPGPQVGVAVSRCLITRVKLPVSSEKFPVPMRREFDRNPLIYVCEN
jgi:hypothetical protein